MGERGTNFYRVLELEVGPRNLDDDAEHRN